MAQIEGYYADPGRSTPAYNQGGNSGQTSTRVGTGVRSTTPISPVQNNWINTGNAKVDALGQARTAYTNDYVNDYGTPGSYMEKYNRNANASGYGLDLDGSPPYDSPGPGGGGGGWGGTAPAGLDQKTYDWLLGQIGTRKPNQYTWQNLDLPEYVAPEFYKFDTGQFDTARQGVTEGIAGARGIGNTAFDRGLAEIDAYENPYLQGVQQRTPGVSRELQQSMAAWGGAGSDAAAQEQAFGSNMDQGMDSVYDLLRRSEDSYTQGLRRGNAGDRMQFDQRLSQEERDMSTGIDMIQQRAEAAHRQEEFYYGKAAADRNYDIRMQEAMANHSGRNQVSQANTQQGNAWNADIMALLQQLGMSGINGAGNQTLNLGDTSGTIA